MSPLHRKVALVTGGTSGIGAAAVRCFCEEGAVVVFTGRTAEKGTALEMGLQDDGLRAKFIQGDVTSLEDCRRAVEETADAYGRLDILFNNAGVIYRDRDVTETTLEEWRATFNVNVTGAFLISREAVPVMKEGGGGVVLFNASYLGLVGGEGVAAYAAAKGALVNLTRAMALDHADDGIRVNAIAPGSVETPMLRQEMEELGGIEETRPDFEAKHPLGRIAQPEEVARLAAYLASDNAGFITGATVPIDGGITAR